MRRWRDSKSYWQRDLTPHGRVGVNAKKESIGSRLDADAASVASTAAIRPPSPNST